MNEFLENEGYVVIKNAISDKNISFAIASFKDNGDVNYQIINYYVKHVLGVVNDHLEWDSEYIKYRLSDNNNSVDAASFHRDIISRKGAPVPPFYTCLSYLDFAAVEVIPRSHLRLFNSYLTSLNWWKRIKRIELSPGDILIIRSSLVHRGIFSKTQCSRKLLQIFEVFPTKQLCLQFEKRILHVPGNEKYNDYMNYLVRNSMTAPFLNWLGYMNTFCGYGDFPIGEYLYISSEGQRRRIKLSSEIIYYAQNKYILNYSTRDLPPELVGSFHFKCYYRNYLLSSLLLILIFTLCFMLFWQLGEAVTD